MKKWIIPICCIAAGVVAGVLIGGSDTPRYPGDRLGPTSTEFALSTLYDLHGGAQSEAVQRSIAVTVAQMYIDAEGRDETARRMIKSMATKVPVLSEEIKAIERRQKETQQRVGR